MLILCSHFSSSSLLCRALARQATVVMVATEATAVTAAMEAMVYVLVLVTDFVNQLTDSRAFPLPSLSTILHLPPSRCLYS